MDNKCKGEEGRMEDVRERKRRKAEEEEET